MVNEQMHPPTTDSDGNDVSTFVAEAVEELRTSAYIQQVECEHFHTGLLRIWTTDRFVYGDVVDQAESVGYQLSVATTHDEEELPDGVTVVDDGLVGYAEFVPEEDHGQSRLEDGEELPVAIT